MRSQFLRYAVAGASGTACQFFVLVALVRGHETNPVLASTVGAVAGALVNYMLNHRFTFASGRAHALALPRFAAVATLGVLLNALVIALLVFAGAHYIAAQAAATIAVLGTGYLANRAWTF